ncbi:hypothetical protein BD777DRAFT_130713 [Yarrowia lipolytica]|nr:hypothetical protein BD777DRAFT_130713 [Yarrowia lipolytica]
MWNLRQHENIRSNGRPGTDGRLLRSDKIFLGHCITLGKHQRRANRFGLHRATPRTPNSTRSLQVGFIPSCRQG